MTVSVLRAILSPAVMYIHVHVGKQVYPTLHCNCVTSKCHCTDVLEQLSLPGYILVLVVMDGVCNSWLTASADNIIPAYCLIPSTSYYFRNYAGIIATSLIL